MNAEETIASRTCFDKRAIELSLVCCSYQNETCKVKEWCLGLEKGEGIDVLAGDQQDWIERKGDGKNNTARELIERPCSAVVVLHISAFSSLACFPFF